MKRCGERHAPLAEFVAAACKTPLLFRPGTKVSYQSMGILLASEIAQRITSLPFREFLRREVFLPLGMRETSLGLGGRRIEDTAQCQVENSNDDWNWNTPYWRDLGAPWGGVHASGGGRLEISECVFAAERAGTEARDGTDDGHESHAGNE